MECQELNEKELLKCLRLGRPHLGGEIVGRECALELWRELMHSRSFNSLVVKCDMGDGGSRVVAFGASVFVSAAFVTGELKHPRPLLNSRLFAGIVNGEPVLRPDAELYGAGQESGLDIVLLCGTYAAESLNRDQIREVEMLLAYKFAECHAGHRLNRLLIETMGEVECRFNGSSGVWRPVGNYGAEHCLFVMTRVDAFSVSGSVAAGLFQYQEPTLNLRDTDKQLLAEALRGGSDDEIAGRLHLSLASVKKRWQMLFDRVADARPNLLPVDGDCGRNDSRGRQKRHHVLAYVRSQPGELRPYRWHTSAE